MIATVRNIDQLIEGVLDNGLAYLGDYLQKRLGRIVVITDHNGWIHYPMTDSPTAGDGRMFIDLPPILETGDYYYKEDDGSLFCPVQLNGTYACVIVRAATPEHILEAVDLVKAYRLAVKCYFSKLNHSNENFEKELTEYLFSPGHANLRDILNLCPQELDFERPCLAVIMEIETGLHPIDPAALRSFINEYLRREKIKAITLFRDKQLVSIVPIHETTTAAGSDIIDQILDLDRLLPAIEHCFQITASIGVGLSTPFRMIEKSFDQARITLILNQLMGRGNFICKFSQLGLYRAIFSQEKPYIQEYCADRLDKLIQHDLRSEGELLPTLRKLLDACGNIKATADSLFIHVNTLYYRINKIEQILSTDLSKMDTRVELHTAIKVWDTLQILDGADKAAPPVSELSSYALQA